MALPRTYTTLERSLFAIFALLCLSSALLFSAILATNVDARRNVAAWFAVLGGVVLTAVSLKIALTGTAWPYFERRIPFRPPPPGQDQ